MNRALTVLLVHLAVPLAFVAGPALVLWRKVTVVLLQHAPPPRASEEAVDPLAGDGRFHSLSRKVDSYVGHGVKGGPATPS